MLSGTRLCESKLNGVILPNPPTHVVMVVVVVAALVVEVVLVGVEVSSATIQGQRLISDGTCVVCSQHL